MCLEMVSMTMCLKLMSSGTVEEKTWSIAMAKMSSSQKASQINAKSLHTSSLSPVTSYLSAIAYILDRLSRVSGGPRTEQHILQIKERQIELHLAVQKWCGHNSHFAHGFAHVWGNSYM
jgi:hypothetical protein